MVIPVAIPEIDPLPESNIDVPKSSAATLAKVRLPPLVSVMVIAPVPAVAEIEAPANNAAALISITNWAALAAGYPYTEVSAVFGETVKVIALPSVILNCKVAEG